MLNVIDLGSLGMYFPFYQGLGVNTAKFYHSMVKVNCKYSYHSDVLFGY